MKPQDKLSTT
jgi:hypothetical protein